MGMQLLRILLAMMILLGVAQRSVELFSGNYLFGFDQGRDHLAVSKIVDEKKPTLIGSEWGAGVAGFRSLFHGPGYYYLLTIPYILFAGDPYGGIVLMVFFGFATIVAAYFLGRRMFGTTGGLLFAALVSLSPALISQSRFLWNTHPASVFIVLVFYLVYTRHFSLAAFFSAFIYHFQTAIALPLVLTLFLYAVIVLRLKSWKTYTTMLTAVILAIAPMILFELRHESLGIQSIVRYLFFQKEVGITRMFLQMLGYDHLMSFKYNFLSSFPTLGAQFDNFVLVLFGVSVILFLRKNRFLVYLSMLPVVSFLIFMMLRNQVYGYYLVELNVAYLLAIVMFVVTAFRQKHMVLLIAWVALVVLFVISAIREYPKNIIADFYDFGGTHKIRGKLDAVDALYAMAGNKPFAMRIFTPPVYTYAYDYLFLWYGKRKYGIVPTEGSQYLLIEPDPAQSWTYKGWLETVIKPGELLEEKRLPSGFIIQKREL